MLPHRLKTLKNVCSTGLLLLDAGLNRVRPIAVTSACPNELLMLGQPIFANGVRRLTAVANEPSTKQQTINASPSQTQSSSGKAPDESNENVDWQMVTELEKYDLGKRWLATMMGEDLETFTDEKISEAIQYLLPSHLFAKDARPSMKHPLEIFGQRKKMKINPDGRPIHSAFYTGQEQYHELIYNMWTKIEELESLPPPSKATKEEEKSSFFYEKPLLVRWMKQHEIEEELNCKLSDDQYDLIVRRLTRIAKHPNAENVQKFLSKYQVQLNEGGEKIEVPEKDENGVVVTMGYRKCSIAEVKLKEGSGKFVINNMPMTKFFQTFDHRKQVLFPFMTIDQLGRFDVDAGVIGGGPTGKAGAIRLGVSRALLAFSESFHQPLDDAGLLMQDMRQVERKKPGQKKARKKFAWVKR